MFPLRMNIRRFTSVLGPLALVPALGALGWAFSTGTIQPASGAPPGGNTCADAFCHTSFPLNSGPGVFTLSKVGGTPGQYTPGDTVDFRIDIQQIGQRRWGFQLTVINNAGVPVGSIVVTEPSRTQVEVGGGGLQYLTHTLMGTDNGTPDVSPGWTFKWKAPAVGAGTVTFYAAGNAANGDATNTGDFIYTQSATLSEGTASVREPDGTRPQHVNLGSNFPNPFNAGTRIPYRLDAAAAGPVSVVLYDIQGRRIRQIYSSRYLGPGEHWVDWDGKDERGASAPSGLYFVRLLTRAGVATHKMTLLR